MSRIIAIIDGEHYPPVVRFALDALRAENDVVAAVFVGGVEKIDPESGGLEYGVPLVLRGKPEEALGEALALYRAEEVVDLSDEPVLTSADRFRLASVALRHGAAYRGADFIFSPPVERVRTKTPTLAIVGTGKRVGKTAVSAFAARELSALGVDVAVVAMGRGGPAAPEIIHGESVRLCTADLLALARQGAHAASDNYEDAVMARVTTVGCRRCGGGMAGETFFSNVAEGALLADTLGKELLILEGSGAAVPPVHADATVLVVGAERGETYIRDYFGPYRLARADLVVLATEEEELRPGTPLAATRELVRRMRPELSVISATFRPWPIEPIDGRRVFFATTCRSGTLPALVRHLEAEHGCTVTGTSTNLSNRALLRADIEAAQGTFDLFLTELKAAAIDVVAEVGDFLGVPTVLCDNVPVAIDGADLPAAIFHVASDAAGRALSRKEGAHG